MAKWIKARPRKNITYGQAYRECSKCHEVAFMPLKYEFCPHCGTSMDKPKSMNYHYYEEE